MYSTKFFLFIVFSCPEVTFVVLYTLILTAELLAFPSNCVAGANAFFSDFYRFCWTLNGYIFVVLLALNRWGFHSIFQ